MASITRMKLASLEARCDLNSRLSNQPSARCTNDTLSLVILATHANPFISGRGSYWSALTRLSYKGSRQAILVGVADVLSGLACRIIAKVPHVLNLPTPLHTVLRHVEQSLAMLKMSWTLCAHGS
jgi:hypothetical protein